MAAPNIPITLRSALARDLFPSEVDGNFTNLKNAVLSEYQRTSSVATDVSSVGVIYGEGLTSAQRIANGTALAAAFASLKNISITGIVEVQGTRIRWYNSTKLVGITPELSQIVDYTVATPGWSLIYDNTENQTIGQGNNSWNIFCFGVKFVSANNSLFKVTPYRWVFSHNMLQAANGRLFEFLGRGYSVENTFFNNYGYLFQRGFFSDPANTYGPTDIFFAMNYLYSGDLLTGSCDYHVWIGNASGGYFAGNHYYGRATVAWKRLTGFLGALQSNYYEIVDNNKPALYLEAGNPGSITLTGERLWGNGSPTQGLIYCSLSKFNRSKISINGCIFDQANLPTTTNNLVVVADETVAGSEQNAVHFGGGNIVNGSYGRRYPIQSIGVTAMESWNNITDIVEFYVGGAYANYIYRGDGVSTTAVNCYIEPNNLPVAGREIWVTNISAAPINISISGSSSYTIKGVTSIAVGERVRIINYASGATRELHITKG